MLENSNEKKKNIEEIVINKNTISLSNNLGEKENFNEKIKILEQKIKTLQVENNELSKEIQKFVSFCKNS